jgi:hypothetical protein
VLPRQLPSWDTAGREELALRDNRPLLARVINPGVPWWVAVPCNVLAGIALVLLALDPADNLVWPLALLGPAAALCGTALPAPVRKSQRPDFA